MNFGNSADRRRRRRALLEDSDGAEDDSDGPFTEEEQAGPNTRFRIHTTC